MCTQNQDKLNEVINQVTTLSKTVDELREEVNAMKLRSGLQIKGKLDRRGTGVSSNRCLGRLKKRFHRRKRAKDKTASSSNNYPIQQIYRNVPPPPPPPPSSINSEMSDIGLSSDKKANSGKREPISKVEAQNAVAASPYLPEAGSDLETGHATNKFMDIDRKHPKSDLKHQLKRDRSVSFIDKNKMVHPKIQSQTSIIPVPTAPNDSLPQTPVLIKGETLYNEKTKAVTRNQGKATLASGAVAVEPIPNDAKKIKPKTKNKSTMSADKSIRDTKNTSTLGSLFRGVGSCGSISSCYKDKNDSNTVDKETATVASTGTSTDGQQQQQQQQRQPEEKNSITSKRQENKKIQTPKKVKKRPKTDPAAKGIIHRIEHVGSNTSTKSDRFSSETNVSVPFESNTDESSPLSGSDRKIPMAGDWYSDQDGRPNHPGRPGKNSNYKGKRASRLYGRVFKNKSCKNQCTLCPPDQFQNKDPEGASDLSDSSTTRSFTVAEPQSATTQTFMLPKILSEIQQPDYRRYPPQPPSSNPDLQYPTSYNNFDPSNRRSRLPKMTRHNKKGLKGLSYQHSLPQDFQSNIQQRLPSVSLLDALAQDSSVTSYSNDGFGEPIDKAQAAAQKPKYPDESNNIPYEIEPQPVSSKPAFLQRVANYLFPRKSSQYLYNPNAAVANRLAGITNVGGQQHIEAYRRPKSMLSYGKRAHTQPKNVPSPYGNNTVSYSGSSGETSQLTLDPHKGKRSKTTVTLMPVLIQQHHPRLFETGPLMGEVSDRLHACLQRLDDIVAQKKR